MIRDFHLKRSLGILIGFGLVLFVNPAFAFAQESLDADYQNLQAINDDLSSLGVRLSTILNEYEDIDVSITEYRFSERLADAEILYLLRDYTRSSLILFDLVEHENNRSLSLYNKALYYLAESQFQLGNELAAREYYQLLVSRGDKENLSSAVRRLIQIGDRLERWSGLELYIEVLASQGDLPADITYIHAKSLLRQRRFQDAIDILEKVQPGTLMYHKSIYLLAVAYLHQGKYSQSESLFKGLVTDNSSYKDDVTVRELSAMNRGRILLEMGDVSQSIDAYQYIPRGSSLFESALYEITWTYVRNADAATTAAARQAEYEKARRALDILLLSPDETKITPEAQLLLGNILLRLGRHKEADKAFEKVINKYSSVRDDLMELSREAISSTYYYDAFVNRKVQREKLLPSIAMQWASDDSKLKKALTVVDDLEQGTRWLQESSEIANELIELLDSDKKEHFFPRLQDGRNSGLAIENRLVALSKRLLQVERDLIQQDLPAELRSELNLILVEREKLEPLFQELPKESQGYQGRVNKMKGRIEIYQKQVYSLKWDIEKIKRELDGLRRFIDTHPGALNVDSASKYKKSAKSLSRVVVDLTKAQKKLEREIIKEKNLVSTPTHSARDDDLVRERYMANLDQERKILKKGYNFISEKKLQALGAIQESRTLVETYHAELIRFETFLKKAVADKSLEIKAELLKEQGLIEGYRRSLHSERENAKEVVGQVASETLKLVEDEVGELVLRADVGVIDVGWAMKEAYTKKIIERLRKQANAVGLIDSEWGEVLE